MRGTPGCKILTDVPAITGARDITMRRSVLFTTRAVVKVRDAEAWL